jgi:hypothetical protein
MVWGVGTRTKSSTILPGFAVERICHIHDSHNPKPYILNQVRSKVAPVLILDPPYKTVKTRLRIQDGQGQIGTYKTVKRQIMALA